MTRTDPRLTWHALRVPKHGHTDAEYEDAWAADPAAGRFAVADGASESAFAALWARLLAEGFLAAKQPADVTGWLEDARRRWAAEVTGLDLPWYAEMKREQGAFATLLGLWVRPPAATSPGTWRALAVGDSCLVRVQADGRLRAFPLTKSSDFGNEPALMGSRTGPPPAPQSAAGPVLPGDRFFLMTDALAQWFLRTSERGGRPWEAVAELLTTAAPADAFAPWIGGLRAGGAMRNDDVTLLAIAITTDSVRGKK
jgi:hypothetical protein